MSNGVVALTALRASDMAKKKLTKADDELVTGLACLLSHQKFNMADADAIMEAFGIICAAVSRSIDTEQRLIELEQRIKKMEKASAPKAPVALVREAG